MMMALIEVVLRVMARTVSPMRDWALNTRNPVSKSSSGNSWGCSTILVWLTETTTFGIEKVVC